MKRYYFSGHLDPLPPGIKHGLQISGDVCLSTDVRELEEKYASAVSTLQDIAAMGKKAGSESAKHRLIMLGEPDDSGRKPVEPKRGD